MQNWPELHKWRNILVFPLGFVPTSATFVAASIKERTPCEVESRINDKLIFVTLHALRGCIPTTAEYALAQSVKLTTVKKGDSGVGILAAEKNELETFSKFITECFKHRGQWEIKT